MRFDKLTTKFQQALADAQSLALGNDNGFIEPQHLLAAMLEQEDGGTASLLARAGVAVPEAAGGAQERDRAAAQGRGPGRRNHRSRATSTTCSTSPTRKRPSAATSSSPASSSCWRSPTTRATTGRLLKEAGLTRKALESGDRSGARRRRRRFAGSRGPARGAEEVHDRPHRARARGQARPGDRPRRRDPAHDPDPAAAHQEQPGADRRAGRRQDGDRRGPRAAHRQRRSAGDARRTSACCRSTWRRCSPAPSTAANSRSG